MNEIDHVSERLGSMEAKIDNLIGFMQEFKQIDKVVALHVKYFEEIIPKVNEAYESRMKTIGFVSAISFVVTAFFNFFLRIHF